MPDQDRLTLLRAALQHLEAARFTDAEALCRDRLTKHANDLDAAALLGLAIGAQGRLEEATPLLDRVARARPDQPHPSRDLADLLRHAGRHAEAAQQYRTWLKHAPNDAAAHHALGLALAEDGQITAAIEHFRRAVTLDPVPAMGWSNLGMMLKVEQQFPAALAAHDAAVARAPTDPRIRVNRAVALLHAGRLAEAWRDYEWRLRLPGHTSLPLATLLPDLAVLDLAGRTVLLTHEEGFGDTLHFVRYVPMLKRLGTRVVLSVPTALTRLLAGTAEIVPPDAATPRFDFHCPFFSLPRAFGTTLETIPADLPYLTADPALTAHWAAQLPQHGLRVGLVWAGQARPWLPGFSTLDRRRSAALADFAPLANTEDVTFVSLQMGPPAAEARNPPAPLVLHDPMPDVTDFADTAGIVANLDLVISVDTAVVHLAGALGKPVFLLDRYDNCWRWFSGREDSPWYPRLRIFRQDRLGDWTAPMQRVAAALRDYAASACSRVSSVSRNRAIAPGPDSAVPARPSRASASAL